ncbi:MAG: hypothetical protein ACLFWL_00680 [Candidatus Brocadiia bacterium]
MNIGSSADTGYEWKNGEWLVCWSEGARPAIFINEGDDLLLIGEKGGGSSIYLPEENLPAYRDDAHVCFAAIGGTHDHTDDNIVGKIRTSMGFAGPLECDVDVEQGRILGQQLLLDLEAEEGGAAFEISEANLPMALPITVRNLNDHWPVVLVDRRTHRWRPLGILDGTAYATLDTRGRRSSLFIGHPCKTNHENVVISLAQVAEDKYVVEFHNPCDHTIDCSVQQSPYFDFVELGKKDLQLAPGKSQTFRIKALA